jgi:hypothetical protein
MGEAGHPKSQRAMRCGKRSPPDQRERYADWTPRQLYAFKLLIDDLKDE